ncbi:MAG: iron ABC transporter permease [Verrucomicrobiales bacterium]
MSKPIAYIVFITTAIFFALFFLWPILTTVQEAFVDDGHFTFDFVRHIFVDPLYIEGLFNAFLIATYSTLAALCIAMPLALVSNRYIFPGKTLFGSLVLVPLILPPFVGAIGIKQILGQEGALNILLSRIGAVDMSAPPDWLGEGRFWGIVIMNALHLYPILYLNITAALANLDPAMEESAQNLGASPWRRFRRITLPLSMPGVFAGATIVFIWSFTELGVPLMFDYQRVTSVQIFNGIKDIGGNPMPYALVAVMLTFSVILYIAGKYFFGRSNFTMTGRAAISTKQRQASPLVGVLCSGLFACVISLAIFPHIGVILMSFATDWYHSMFPQSFTLRHYSDALGHELTVPSIANSLKYASISTLVDIVLGIAIAFVIVRSKIPGRGILDALSMLPLAVPGLVMAFGYLAMTREGQPFHFLLPAGNPTILLVIAYAVRRLPYVVRSAVAGFQQTSVDLEEAAQNLGATPFRALRRITIPLITANLIAGGLLAFAFAMLEVSDSLILAQQQPHYPITKAIYTLFGSLGNGHSLASALGVWSMAFLAITIMGASLALGKKLGALFRV